MKTLLRVVTAVLALLFLAAAAVGGTYWFRENYTYWNGSFHRLDASSVSLRRVENPDLEGLSQFPNLEALDIRDTGLGAEDYEALHARYPQCRIRWDVPFQGALYDQAATKVTVTSLTAEDVVQLDYLTELLVVDGWKCQDLEALADLQRRRPEVKVFYSIFLDGKEYDCDTYHMELEDADEGQLERFLIYLPRLQRVHLKGELPPAEGLTALTERYPQVVFTWETSLLGVDIPMGARELDLSDRYLGSADLLLELLPLFPELTRVNLMRTGIPAEELMALAGAYPGVRFLFALEAGGGMVFTDAETLDLTGVPFASAEEAEAFLSCFRDLKTADLSGCGLDSETLAALDEKLPARILWTVDLAGAPHRTDAVYFTPNREGLVCTDENIADLRYCVDMVCVDIGHAEAVTHCRWAANMPHLKYLIVADSGVRSLEGVENCRELVFLELFQSKVKDYSPLLGCTALEDLNLCWTFGDPEPILQMPWLKRLWWSGAPWSARSQFPTALPDTEIELKTQSSTGAGWREGQHYFDMRDFIGMEYMTG